MLVRIFSQFRVILQILSIENVKPSSKCTPSIWIEKTRLCKKKKSRYNASVTMTHYG